ncbi:hypothetical protein DAPPUDRAFT_233793 [Daphnia pulex]|uniref:Uncharacterized protein n=1 Tax=Daphnia pulex TaxID=6669 RepID=E9FVR6_DAPPU|nr:hypothetical protein DAPPUDRAFT_233793 [Daphnia pulex]|eukprot:EFX88599.1 hypothetical protein DAPPUDRAFT_233793 [Daphnia pulex]
MSSEWPPTAGAQQRRDRWSLIRRPLKGIASKLTRTKLSSSPANQRHEQTRFVNLSEQQGVPPREYSSQHSILSAALRDLNKINGNRLLLADDTSGIESSGQLFTDEEEENRNKRRRQGPPEVKKARGADPRHSFLVTTSIVPDMNSIYSRVPTVSLYETPIFEQDSYLEALQLSRLPCQSLADPDDCHDSTRLFRQQSPAGKTNEAPASKKLLATIRVLINFHERQLKVDLPYNKRRQQRPRRSSVIYRFRYTKVAGMRRGRKCAGPGLDYLENQMAAMQHVRPETAIVTIYNMQVCLVQALTCHQQQTQDHRAWISTDLVYMNVRSNGSNIQQSNALYWFIFVLENIDDLRIKETTRILPIIDGCDVLIFVPSAPFADTNELYMNVIWEFTLGDCGRGNYVLDGYEAIQLGDPVGAGRGGRNQDNK